MLAPGLAAPARAAALVVRLYQVTLGRILVSRCRFYPSCSDYAAGSLRANGLIIGLAQSIWRIARCGPWASGGFDPVKERRKHHG